MVRVKCVVCGKFKRKVRKKQKYCGAICRERDRGSEKSCKFCNKIFKGKKDSKFCSMVCAAKQRIPDVIARNISRRKYLPVEGMTRQQVFRNNNPDQYKKDLMRDVIKRHKLVNALGGKCVRCSYDQDIRALQVDHINADGHLDRKKKGRAKIYRYWINNLDEARENLQILCANCNKIKQIENCEFKKKVK